MASATLNNLHSFAVSVARGFSGLRVRRTATQPARTLELYEFEACPYCRKVREVFSELDLDYLCHPCAKGSRNRATVQQLGGRLMFPFLVDPNATAPGGRQLYESEDIITYLYDTYAGGRSSLSRLAAPLNTLGSTVASAIRPRGRRVMAQAAVARPEQTLELYSFENSPYCRKVREVLQELDLDFLVHNVAKGSSHRPHLVALGGRMRVPYLVDPNTGTSLYESDDIVAYLQRTYGGAAANPG